MRKAVGQRWSRDKKNNEQMRTEYEALDMKAKKLFRQAWAQRVLSDIEVGRQHEKSYTRVDSKKGEFFTFGRIAVEYGYTATPREAMAAAIRYCKCCIAMGGDWLLLDNLGGVVLFNFLHRQWQQDFKEAWMLYEKEKASGKSDQDEKKDPNKKDSPHSKHKKDSPDAKKNPKTKPATPCPELTALLCGCAKLKRRYEAATTSAKSLAEAVVSDPTWVWASSDANIGTVKAAIAELEKSTSPGVRLIIMEDQKELKATVGKETLLKSCKEFLHIESMVKALEDQCSRLQRMHRANKK